RAGLKLGNLDNSFSWMFGIERMLLGFAMGDEPEWQGCAPYAEVAGLGAAELGPVLQFIQQLKRWYSNISQNTDRSLVHWQQLMLGEQGLLLSLFDFSDEQDQLIYSRLSDALVQLVDAADSGDFAGEISLAVLREAWLEQASSSGLSQRFLAGSITFSTLMPMRAIPFKRIYLLGLNDGDYPRSRMRDDFDLMAHEYRPGDRSRRDDDRYLFLEALLSARQAVYLSWVGRNIRNNSELPPSVLVSQLRDLLNSGWHIAPTGKDNKSTVADSLTTVYPLQPFSTQYFNGNFATYAHEWQAAYQPAELPKSPLSPEGSDTLPVLTLRLLDDFLANPCRHYLTQRFKTRFYRAELAAEDTEPFVLDALQLYQLKQQLLDQLLLNQQAQNDDRYLDAAVSQLAKQARLPLALFGQLTSAQIAREVDVVFSRYRAAGTHWQRRTQALPVTLQAGVLQLQDTLSNVYFSDAGQQALILLRPSAIKNKGELRWHTLRSAWLQQLAANAQGEALSIYQYGLDDAVQLLAQPQAKAQQQVESLIQSWQSGLAQPLPIMPKTAFCYLQTGDEAKCREMFEGGYQHSGERDNSPELARYYPDFASLMAAGFPDWAEKVYGPLLQSQVVASTDSEGQP
ncbi:exodeoxyribonuclease V subunit gamma, partial [Rheinheimera baltica]